MNMINVGDVFPVTREVRDWCGSNFPYTLGDMLTVRSISRGILGRPQYVHAEIPGMPVVQIQHRVAQRARDGIS